MHSLARWARRGGLTVSLLLSSVAVLAARPVSPAAAAAPPTITTDDIAESNKKIAAAYGALVTMWSAEFKQVGAQFAAPQILRYRGNARTSCGILPANNALYCPQRNTIFFDEVFVARQAQAAGEQLGTDGDMAAVGIIAHEMGHAVATQLGADSPIPYENEAMADCLAGSFAKHGARDGSLEKGDLEEAFFGLAAAGDPTPQFTGDRRTDRRIATRAAMLGHGTREQRLSNFNTGYNGGTQACLPGVGF